MLQHCKFMLSTLRIPEFQYINDTSKGDQYLDYCVELVFLCYSRPPEDGTLVPKHEGV